MNFSEDWEFAISHATGDYITVLGDDDAMIPSSLSLATEIIQNYAIDALTWKKFDYHWPDHIMANRRNFLKGVSKNSMRFVDAKKALNLMVSFQFGYDELPCIYNSFVKKSVIDTVRARSANKMFFGGVLPDVYSGIAIASNIKYYIYLDMPITLNAASSKSSGVLQSSKNLSKKNKKKIQDILNSGSQYDHRIGEFNTSIKAIILGEYLLAKNNIHAFKGKQPSWLLYLLALRRELKTSRDPQRIIQAIKHTQSKTKILLPLPKFNIKDDNRENIELVCNFKLSTEILDSFSATRVLENLLTGRDNIKLKSTYGEIRNIFSRLKIDLITLYKMYRTNYNFKN